MAGEDDRGRKAEGGARPQGPFRRSVLGRYLHDEPIPKGWKRVFDATLWALPILLLGDPDSGGGHGGGGGGGATSVRYDGGSCVCGSEPKLCGKWPGCKWKPKVVSRRWW